MSERRRGIPAPKRSENGVSRRNFLIITGVAVGGAIVAAIATNQPPSGPTPDHPAPAPTPERFTGDIEPTKQYLLDWDNKMVKGEKVPYEDQIDLAVAFVAKQIGFDKVKLRAKISLLSDADYNAKVLASKNPNALGSTEIFDFSKDMVYIKQSSARPGAYFEFADLLEEVLYIAPNGRPFPQGKIESGITAKIVSEKGVTAFDATGNAYRQTLDEVIAYDASVFFMKKLGIIPRDYKDEARLYDRDVVSLYGGDPTTLLQYRNASDWDGFMVSLNQKLQAAGIPQDAVSYLAARFGAAPQLPAANGLTA